MKAFLAALLLALSSAPAMGQAISDYTEYDVQADCALIARAPDDQGDWADYVCSGYANYPFVIRYSDGREAITYGFATEPGMPTFSPFNYANGTIEWRVRIERNTETPVAAIQRWFIADAEGNWDREVLVISRVGQPDGGGACAVAFIDARTEAANQRARQLADEMVDDFECGADEPLIDESISGIVSAG